MQAQAELMETVVKVLEQTVHGTLARFLRAKAEHLAAVSEGLEKKLRYFNRRLMASLSALLFLIAQLEMCSLRESR